MSAHDANARVKLCLTHPTRTHAAYDRALVDQVRQINAGHDRMGTTVWLGLVLWGIMGVGEAGLMQQSSLAIALWCCLFGLPCLYLQCRHILDALVEESLHLVALSLQTGQSPAVLSSCVQSCVSCAAVLLLIATVEQQPTLKWRHVVTAMLLMFVLLLVCLLYSA